MCGIAGSFGLRGAPGDPALLRRMIAAIAHRGPDGQGVHVEGPVGFAHARLSIIDLAGGSQPMQMAGQPFWITFNGEIFNYVELREELVKKGHKFTTKSDTEVILHLYREEGERCVERLNGQWAFAIWDGNQRKLFLSRDRLGIRPLFYTQTADQFLFASEIKALLSYPGVSAELDLQGLDEIFTFWTTLAPRTAFRNIWQLLPGHSMVIEGGQVRLSEYWKLSLEPHETSSRVHEDHLAEQLFEVLQDAARIRLRSDVPVGAYLSGGLDSTIIAALVKDIVGDRLRTFSVSFADPAFDESPYQEEASAFLHTQHSSIRCLGEDIAEVFPEVVRHAEQPIIRTAPAPMYQLAKLVRQSGYKVVLTGEGADEMLGGYDIFKETKIRSFWGRHPQSTWRPYLLKRLYPYMEGIQRQSSEYLKSFFRVTPNDLKNPFFSHLPRWELTSKLKLFFSAEVQAELQSSSTQSDLETLLPPSYATLSAFQRAEYLEARYLLPGYILSSQGDRMAMAHGIEGRYPFLDYRVVEFASKLPSALKMKALNQKYLLKKTFRGFIPDSIRNRYKQPYRAPDGQSFFTSRFNYVEEMLASALIRKHGIFDAKAVEVLSSKFRSGRGTSVRDNMALVGILSTQLLIEQFRARTSS